MKHLLTAVFCLFLASPVFASPVTEYWSGEVSQTFGSTASSLFTVGQTVKWTVSYDDADTGIDVMYPDGSTGTFLLADNPAFTLLADAVVTFDASLSSFFALNVPRPGLSSSYRWVSGDSGVDVFSAGVFFTGSNLGVGGMRIMDGGESTEVLITNIAYSSTVPEPTSALLFMPALALVAAHRRVKN